MVLAVLVAPPHDALEPVLPHVGFCELEIPDPQVDGLLDDGDCMLDHASLPSSASSFIVVGQGLLT